MASGQVQRGVDPRLLLPARTDLVKARLEAQRALLRAGRPRHTMIQITPGGVIWDGHHAVRAAAEEGVAVDVRVVGVNVPPAGPFILDLPVG